jgi:hypothetical protein
MTTQPFGERALITDEDFLPEETPDGYPKYHNYKRDREAARLKAMGWSLDEIAEHLSLTDRRTGEADPRRAAKAVQRGLSLVHQTSIDEKRLEQLQALEMMKRHIWESMDHEHVLVQQGRVVLKDGLPIEDRRFALECMDRLVRIESTIMDLVGTKAAQRFSVEADQIGSDIAQLISLINADDTIQATVERLDTPALDTGDDDE